MLFNQNRTGIIAELSKAWEAGQYGGAPATLTQGSAVQVENLEPVMQNVCFTDKQLVLQQMLNTKKVRSLHVQFTRQLSYGNFGASAQLDGAVGQEDTLDVVRVMVPMCFYAQLRKSTLSSDLVETVDGVSGSDRQADGAAKVIAGDVEFDLFRGCDEFSNAGVFDGNPLAIPDMPNMRGLFLQIRQSDTQVNTQDLMFSEFGSEESVVINKGAFLDQVTLEDAMLRSNLNNGEADTFICDPRVVSQYNKINLGISRIVLGGQPTDATGADLKKQWTSNGPCEIKKSRFLSGKTAPARRRPQSLGAPTFALASVTIAGVTTPFLATEVYKFTVTAQNEAGEGVGAVVQSVTVAVNGDSLQMTITPPSGTVRFFNVYRSLANGTKTRFVGRVANSGAATTVFIDLGNKLPGSVNGVLLQADTWQVNELAPYSKKKLAEFDLSMPEAHFRFLTLVGYQPRKNVLVTNLIGTNFDK